MFLGLTIIFMAAWAAMFTSRVFRLLMMTWGLFIMTSVVTMALLVVILTLALYSWLHLDLGLAEYCEYSQSYFLPQVFNALIVKSEEPPHPADKVRWSLAVTSDPERGLSPLSEKGNPNVTWVHLPAPFIVKPEPSVQKVARSPSKSSMSSVDSRQSTSSYPSSLFTRSRSGSLPPDPHTFPPPGLMPPPNGLPMPPVSTSPTERLSQSPLQALPLHKSFLQLRI